MASKKYTILLGLFTLLTSYVSAQVQPTSGYDWRDSSVIPSSRMAQHNEFLNNQYPYPAKPRNQWEIGVKVGAFTIGGDVPALFPTPGFGIHVRKALGYVFSLRAEYMYGIGKGLNWKGRTAGVNDAWLNNGYSPNGIIYDNYKTTMQDLSIQGIFTMNNIRFHKDQTKFVVYGIVGLGASVYDTKVNALNGTTPYDFSGINGNVYKDRKQTRSDLKALMDDSYETEAENDGDERAKLGGKTLKFSKTFGAGMAFKLSKTINLAIEDRFTLLSDDLLDGQRWQNASGINGSRILSPSNDSYNFFSVGLNFNIGKKAVQPLWWINPLNYAYSEINAPKHMKLPKPVLDDADGDGVTDQFDNEPNTPAGAPVDSHGVARDTDGDGVPDFRDKELVTPTICQPVDADGVGKCPCPDTSCFAGLLMKKSACDIGDLPSVSFNPKTFKLSKDAEAVLASVADRLRQNPNCRIVVTSYTCEPSKSAQQLSWDRVNTVISYLVEKQGISSDRFVWKYGETGGDCNTVDLRAAEAGDEGPNTVPAPHPNLRRKG